MTALTRRLTQNKLETMSEESSFQKWVSSGPSQSFCVISEAQEDPGHLQNIFCANFSSFLLSCHLSQYPAILSLTCSVKVQYWFLKKLSCFLTEEFLSKENRHRFELFQRGLILLIFWFQHNITRNKENKKRKNALQNPVFTVTSRGNVYLVWLGWH